MPATDPPFISEDDPPPDDLLYDAWMLIANGAYWDHTDPKRTTEWFAARNRWRDRWHATFPEGYGNA